MLEYFTRFAWSLRKNGILWTLTTTAEIVGELAQITGTRLFRSPLLHEGVKIPLRNRQISNSMVLAMISGNGLEKEEREMVRKHLNPDDDVIELGGCSGFLITYISKHQHSDSRAITVEPNPRMIPVIERTRQLNHMGFDIIQAAYNPTGKSTTMALTDENRGVAVAKYRTGAESVNVEGISLKTLVERASSDSFVLVVDIEGSERDLIGAELDVLERYCSVLVIEFHENQDNIRRTNEIANAREALQNSEFEQIDGSDDVQVYRNTTLH